MARRCSTVASFNVCNLTDPSVTYYRDSVCS